MSDRGSEKRRKKGEIYEISIILSFVINRSNTQTIFIVVVITIVLICVLETMVVVKVVAVVVLVVVKVVVLFWLFLLDMAYWLECCSHVQTIVISILRQSGALCS